MKIGVTGGAGFIGGYVCEEAARRGHHVVTLDHRADGSLPSHLQAIADSGCLDVRLGDVRSAVDMAELAAHVDGVIHLAACLGTQETVRNPMPAAETNIFGGIHFLQACAQYDVPGAYIGVGNHFMDNSYSITKTTIERFVRMYNSERHTRVNIVRALNAYGPRQSVAPPFGSAKVRKIMPAFVCRALTGQDIEVYGDGLQVSDMVAVHDVARALVLAVELAAEGVVLDRAVEVGPPADQSMTVRDVAQRVIAEAASRGYPQAGIVHLPMRPGETPGARVTADTSTLELVGIHPESLTPFSRGAAQTVGWYAENWLPQWLTGQATRHECEDACNPGNCPRQDF